MGPVRGCHAFAAEVCSKPVLTGRRRLQGDSPYSGGVFFRECALRLHLPHAHRMGSVLAARMASLTLLISLMPRFLAICSQHPVPDRLPLQAAQGELHHKVLPPQHQLERLHLSRHPERPVESGIDRVEGCVTA